MLPRSMEAVGDASLTFRLNGDELLADISGALVWPGQRTLAVADLHLEKGSAFARQGSLLPPYDTRATLERLAAAVARYRPVRVICVGDSFHDHGAGKRLALADQVRLRHLTAVHDWIWICGNHDPQPPADWGGRVLDEIVMGALVFRHEAVPQRGGGEVSGHFHPKAGFAVRGRHVGGRCFVTGGRRLILPAFGAYAGGLDVREPAITRLFPNGFQVHVIGRDKLHSFTAGARSTA